MSQNRLDRRVSHRKPVLDRNVATQEETEAAGTHWALSQEEETND